MAQVDQIEDFQSTLIARKIATYVPSSLSIDDFKVGKNKIKQNKNQLGDQERKPFIPPSPSVSFATSATSEEKISPNVSKFAFLLGDKVRSPKKSISMTKMKYELPNVQKIGTASKNLKPILAVSFSSFSLNSSDGLDSLKKAEPVKASQSSQSSQIIIPEAKQIDSEVSD